jgi:hypothetical protein
MPSLGHQELVEKLAQRILHSQGGAFLVTGFRGAGKTTLVRHAVERVIQTLGKPTRILPIYITLARPVSPAELLFVVVRQIHEQLDEDGTFDRLPKRTQKLIRTAFIRTSLAVKEIRGSAVEGSLAVGASSGSEVLLGGASNINLTRKRSRTESTESAYLTYSEVDVEYDLLRILHALSGHYLRHARAWSRLWRRQMPTEIHPIVVLDEVDKLTALNTNGTDGMQELEHLIGAMKNVLTSPNVHFIVVAGVDLHDQVIRDTSRGIGVYESVFGWQLYVPCLWHAPEAALDTIAPWRSSPDDVTELSGFLRYRARGVTRRLWQEINRLVQWDAGIPWLDVGEDGDLVTFFFRLEQILSDFIRNEAHPALFPIQLDMDRRVLSTFYAMDRILRTSGRIFTAGDLVSSEDEPDFDPILQVTTGLAGRLLEYLTTRRIVEAVYNPGSASSTFIGDLRDSQSVRYKLVDDVRAVIAGFAHKYQDVRQDPFAHQASAPASEITVSIPLQRDSSLFESAIVAGLNRRPVEPIEVIDGRYLLRRLIGSGGVGSVYEAEDTLHDRIVAIKLLDPWALRDSSAKARFLREGQVASMLIHPNIVRTYDVVDIDDERTAIVMERVTGPTLREFVGGTGIPVRRAVSIALDLLAALNECVRVGVSRIDLKPSNVIMRDGSSAVVIDLGLARRSAHDDAVTVTGAVIGTPAYMAPEQINGGAIDIRTDIYCVALVLIECITGKPPRSGDSLEQIIIQIVQSDLDLSSLLVSPELLEVIKCATARDPAERFPTPEEFRLALLASPEGSHVQTRAD